MRQIELLPSFVDDIPEQLMEGRLYVSRRHSIAIHLCCCGCRGEVVTPLSPAEWSMTLHGGKLSLFPSIGNWGFPCKSHYWIRSNRIEWALPMSDQEIALVRARDRADLAIHVAHTNSQRDVSQPWWRWLTARIARAWHRVLRALARSD